VYREHVAADVKLIDPAFFIGRQLYSDLATDEKLATMKTGTGTRSHRGAGSIAPSRGGGCLEPLFQEPTSRPRSGRNAREVGRHTPCGRGIPRDGCSEPPHTVRGAGQADLHVLANIHAPVPMDP